MNNLNKDNTKDRINFIKNNISLSYIFLSLYQKEISPNGASDCPICNKRKKWFTIKDNVGWCYSSSCPSKGFSKYRTLSVIDVYMHSKSISFYQTIDELERYVIDIKGIDTNQIFINKVNRLDKRHNFLSRVLNVYHQQLWNSPYLSGINYLRGRGFSDISIQNAGIGYVGINNCLISNGFKIEELIEEGLYNTEYNCEYYGANRVIFPLKDREGRIVHLQSRYIKYIPQDEHGDKWPRYKATKSIEDVPSITKCLFFKERIVSYLYRKDKTIYISEGIPDTLSLVQLGFPVVGMLGINNLLEHIEDLREFSNIIIIGDNDKFDKNHINYPNEYKSWRVLLPQLLKLQQAIPSSNVYGWMPPKSYKGRKVKDINDLLKLNISMEEISSLIHKHKWELVYFFIQKHRKDLSKHEDIIRLIKYSGKHYHYFNEYISSLNLSSIEYITSIIDM